MHCLTKPSDKLPEGFPHQTDIPAGIIFGHRLEEYSYFELIRILMFLYLKTNELQGQLDAIRTLGSKNRIITP